MTCMLCCIDEQKRKENKVSKRWATEMQTRRVCNFCCHRRVCVDGAFDLPANCAPVDILGEEPPQPAVSPAQLMALTLLTPVARMAAWPRCLLLHFLSRLFQPQASLDSTSPTRHFNFAPNVGTSRTHDNRYYRILPVIVLVDSRKVLETFRLRSRPPVSSPISMQTRCAARSTPLSSARPSQGTEAAELGRT